MDGSWILLEISNQGRLKNEENKMTTFKLVNIKKIKRMKVKLKKNKFQNIQSQKIKCGIESNGSFSM